MMRPVRNRGMPGDVSGGMKRSIIAVLYLALLLAGCSAAQPPATAGPVTDAQLKLALLDRLGELWYCDPDEYPLPRGDEAQLAQERLPEVRADAEAFSAITGKLGLEPDADLAPDEQLAVYRLWKRLNAIQLIAAGDGRSAFDILTRAANVPEGGVRTTGTIDRAGAIEIDRQVPSGEPNCPICLTRGTLIATPDGPVPVEELRTGDFVWSPDTNGRPRAVPILRAGRSQAPRNHRVVALVLDDGRRLEASPAHPLADGRVLGELSIGDPVDGARVASATLIRYSGGSTYDIRPAGPSGAYWADGVLLGSTLGR
jgi:hypothetical protein